VEVPLRWGLCSSTPGIGCDPTGLIRKNYVLAARSAGGQAPLGVLALELGGEQHA
jgi:hypothetical protein